MLLTRFPMRRSLLLLLVLVVGAAHLFATQAQRKSHKPKAKAAAVQPQPAPAVVPQPPPPPPTPEHGPSSPPDVTLSGGQLTITARNSTMSDVLNAVRQKTGAAVDMTGASNDRVVGKFGPGAPREVMAQLLNGSHYDFVLLGSPTDPGALKKIVLMARAVGPEPPPQQQPQQGFQQQPLQAVPQVEVDQNNDNGSADVVPEQNPPEEEPQEQPEQPEQGQPGQNGPMVKTPEQLLRELQQQQQQQQQQQMQNGQPGPPER